MGSIILTIDNEKLGVSQQRGEPWHVVVRRGTEESGLSYYTQACEEVGQLSTLWRVLQFMGPPEKLIAAQAYYTDNFGIDAIFGTAKATATFSIIPTELLVTVDGRNYRAWLLRKSTTKFFRFGGPTTNSDFVGALWLDETGAVEWAQDLYKNHPLARALVGAMHRPTGLPFCINLAAGNEPAAWPEVEVETSSFRLCEAGKLNFARSPLPDLPTGVYVSYHLHFHAWSGTVNVHQPEMWVLRCNDHLSWPTVPATFRLVATNGTKQEVFALEAPVEEESFGTLPKLPPFDIVDASGNLPTFWPSAREWEKFAKANCIVATYRRAPGGYDLSVEKETLILLNEHYAQLAYNQGIRALPNSYVQVSREDFIWNPSSHHYEVQQGPLAGMYAITTTNDMLHAYPPSDSFSPVWVKSPAYLRICLGAHLREPGDERDSNELTVFTDGTAAYGKFN